MISKKQFLILLTLLLVVLVYFITIQDNFNKDNPSPELISESSQVENEENLSISTLRSKKDHKSKVLTLEELLMKVNQNEKLTSDELFMSLNNMFKISPKKQHLSVTLKMTSIFLYLDKNYEDYKHSIGQLYSDSNAPDLLRLPMLQIIDHNFDNEARVLIESIFSHYNSEGEWLLGESALVLAKHDIDISQELIDRYDLVGDIGKSFYAQSLAHLGTTEALLMVKESMPQMQNVKAKSSLLQSYAKLSAESSSASDAIDTLLAIANKVDIKKKNSVKDEIFSMQAVMALGSMGTDNSYMNLLKVAQKEDALPSTRIAALESLTQADPNLLNLMQDELRQLAFEVEKTQLIDTIDKQRIQKRIRPLINKN